MGVCSQTPAQILGIEPIPEDDCDKSGIVAWFGSIWLCIFKKILIPCTGFAATAVSVVDKHSEGPNCVNHGKGVRKASDLPIYSKECRVCGKSNLDDPRKVGQLENVISSCRKELWVWTDKCTGLKQELINVYTTGVAHTTSTLDFLREESNLPERYGAIFISGLTGMIFGLRGGIFKKLMYSTTGAGGMAALCYPKESAEVTEIALGEAKKYFVVGYHFVFGEAPEFPDVKKYVSLDHWISLTKEKPTKSSLVQSFCLMS